MAENEKTQKLNGRTIAIAILIAVVAAVVITLVQELVLGHSYTAVTGAIVAVITLTAIGTMRKES